MILLSESRKHSTGKPSKPALYGMIGNRSSTVHLSGLYGVHEIHQAYSGHK
jgi:hypothetical protein